jgi:putative transcriptional regulator
MMESLQGNFLVATNQMRDPRFSKCVILICFHDHNDGAMGLVVNQPLADFSMLDVFKNLDLACNALDLPPVYFGGPVDGASAFIIHSDDYTQSQSQQVMDQVFLSRDPNLLLDVVKGRGPEHYLFTLGYAGWSPGQLEQELCGEGWLTLPAEAADLFHTPALSLRTHVTAKYGIDINLYTGIPGNA